ncbi:ferrous iron transport protein B [soil metagenome]
MSTLNVLLVGSPNSGKTTLFNRLTGLRAKTVNYPGSTVDLLVGTWGDVQLFDTPGVYSLHPRSPDEEITLSALKTKEPHAVVVVVDATQLSRQLAIALQLKAMFRSKDGEAASVVVAITMLDLMKAEGESVDLEKLSRELGLKVIPTLNESAIEDLRHAIESEKAIVPRTITQLTSTTAFDLREAKRIKDLVVTSPSIAAKAAALQGPRAATRAIDRSVLHPVFGPLLFLAVMTTLFTLIYWLAQPLMNLVDAGFSGLGAWVTGFSWVDPENLLTRLISDGLIAGAGAVLIFVPQIFILFCGLVFLEDSGYLARAATIVDRPLKAIGLGGRSFVPLLSGFACAVPAMMAARTVNSRRERMLTLFILPLMSCSARLPVYALLLGFVFGTNSLKAGFALAALYVGSITAGVIAASLLGRIAETRGVFGKEKSFLLLELPLYRRPKATLVLKQALLRTKSYVKRTGPVILTLSVLIWAGTNFPNYRETDPTVRLESSFAGQAGQVLSPVFEPMGGDWRTGLGLISAFAAREVFVSTMAVIFHVTENGNDNGTMQSGLLEQMHEAKAPDGLPLFTLSSVLGLMLFFMIALQCLATVSVAIRESGSLKFAMVQLILFNVVAYVLTVALVQGLRAVGVS